MGDVVHEVHDIDVLEFVDAYIACALWTGVERRDDHPDKDHDKDYDCIEEDIDPSDLAWLKADAEKWCRANYQVIADAEASGDTKLSGDGTGAFSHAGHDFWLTRNGHGAGFWDGDWPEPQADLLDKAAKAVGELDLFTGDDDVVYRL